jgi:hypothetical protein
MLRTVCRATCDEDDERATESSEPHETGTQTEDAAPATNHGVHADNEAAEAEHDQNTADAAREAD